MSKREGLEPVPISREVCFSETCQRLRELTGEFIILKTNSDGEAFFVNTDPGVYDGEMDNNGVKVVFKKDVNTGVDARITVKLGS